MIRTGTGFQHLHLRDLRTVRFLCQRSGATRDRSPGERALRSRRHIRTSSLGGHDSEPIRSRRRSCRRAASGDFVPTEPGPARAACREYESASQLLPRLAKSTVPEEKTYVSPSVIVYKRQGGTRPDRCGCVWIHAASTDCRKHRRFVEAINPSAGGLGRSFIARGQRTTVESGHVNEHRRQSQANPGLRQ